MEKYTWTFLDKKGNAIVCEWRDSSSLETVRQVYVDTWLHNNLYQTLPGLSELTPGEASRRLNEWWILRSAKYRLEMNGATSKTFLVVATMRSEIVGFALFHSIEKKSVEVSPLCVIPAMRSSGIGKELLFSILKKTPDLTRIFLVTARANKGAIAFYKACEFTAFDNEEFPDKEQSFEWVRKTPSSKHMITKRGSRSGQA